MPVHLISSNSTATAITSAEPQAILAITKLMSTSDTAIVKERRELP
ncbi:hypothetical protein [uncultured Nostoc sp.]